MNGPASRSAALDSATSKRASEGLPAGRHYLQSAFAHRPERHIVNDKLGNVPVTITHCDLTSCTRVLTSVKEGGSLSVRCWSPADGMALLVNELEYTQLSKDVPLQDVSHVVTTWKEWRAVQPQSKVYVGGQTAL